MKNNTLLAHKFLAWFILVLLLAGMAGLAGAADISTHSFNSGLNCYGVYRLPDTGQTVHYSTAAGDDSDYHPAAVQPKYTVYNGGVETSSYTVDNITGRMWVTNPNDVSGGQYVSNGNYTWEVAIAKCEGLSYAGYSDWRLPNIKELQSIVDYSRQNPSINTTYFLNTQNSAYWSSTTYMPVAASAWFVSFGVGDVVNNVKTNGLCVRCVRGGP